MSLMSFLKVHLSDEFSTGDRRGHVKLRMCERGMGAEPPVSVQTLVQVCLRTLHHDHHSSFSRTLHTTTQMLQLSSTRAALTSGPVYHTSNYQM